MLYTGKFIISHLHGLFFFFSISKSSRKIGLLKLGSEYSAR